MPVRDTPSGDRARDRDASVDARGVASHTPEERERRRVRLSHSFNYCRHGHEVGRLTVEAAQGHWILWAHYPCSHCREVALEAFDEEPTEAVIAGRHLLVRAR
jgi:hypothetical protein